MNPVKMIHDFHIVPMTHTFTDGLWTVHYRMNDKTVRCILSEALIISLYGNMLPKNYFASLVPKQPHSVRDSHRDNDKSRNIKHTTDHVYQDNTVVYDEYYSSRYCNNIA